MDMRKEANETALDRLRRSRPALTGVVPARDAAPGLGGRTITHAGPPIGWADMCGPMRGAVVGGVLYEGWAKDASEAAALAGSGSLRFLPNHDVGRVGSMAGVVTPSMPLLAVTARPFGNTAYVPIHDGLGAALGFGAHGPEVIGRLHWLEEVLAPALADVLAQSGPIELFPFLTAGLAMGDELHQRNLGASALFFRHLAPLLVKTVQDRRRLGEILDYLAGQDHFFLNLAMAAAKAAADAARDIPGSTLVTAMSRNGVNFGIQVSALGKQWFQAPCSPPKGLFFPGSGPEDANPDMGDSAILETVGLGGSAMGCAPSVLRFLGGGTAREAADITREMDLTALGRNEDLPMPQMEFRGVPLGIDLAAVVESGVTPIINTGIAHRSPGIGQVGAGAVRAPMDCFIQALLAYADGYGL